MPETIQVTKVIDRIMKNIAQGTKETTNKQVKQFALFELDRVKEREKEGWQIAMLSDPQTQRDIKSAGNRELVLMKR